MIELINSNALRIPLEDESIQMCVTSPPYWNLRDYGLSDQLGLEKTPEEYVDNLVCVFREVKRVLRKDGVLFLNLGDSYAGSGRGNNPNGKQGTNKGTLFDPDNSGYVPNGLKPKDLIGIPWRVAFALQADGWWLRSDIIWHKPNPMPESVKDRPTKSHEYVFLLTKSQKYYYDAEAIREPANYPNDDRKGRAKENHKSMPDGLRNGLRPGNYTYDLTTRNRRTVWTISTQSYSGAHFATYPEKLVEPCIKAGTSEKGCCPECGKPWKRVVVKIPPGRHESEHQTIASGRGKGGDKSKHAMPSVSNTTGWQPTCTHNAEPVPCVILDPFVGSGTTLLVARNLGRSAIGLDLSYTYLHDQASKRLELDKLKKWTNV